MNDGFLLRLGARELAQAVRQREITAEACARVALLRIRRLQPHYRPYIHILEEEQVLAQARQVDIRIRSGRVQTLAGVPLAVKDFFDVAGTATTGGTKVFAERVATEDATAVTRLRAAGAVVVGKTSTHELAYGFTNENPHYGNVLNPWDVERIPGGSSGGNAAALAAGIAGLALGGDTGGSIRQPAALCGVVGLKTTYGRVSRHGSLPLAWSMDTVGPMARRVEDAALMLQVMAGHDPRDEASSRDVPPRYVELLERSVRGIRIGVPTNHFFEAADPEVSASVRAAITTLEGLGATTHSVHVPHLEAIRGAHRAVIFCEAASAYEDVIRNSPEALSTDVRELLQAGMFFPATQYLAAQRVRRAVTAAYQELWRGIDVLACPTSPIAATRFGETSVRLAGEERPLVRAYLDHTLPFNLTGQPALSVPCGFTTSGLPIGLQLVGRPYEEELILRLGHQYERETEWHTRHPAVPQA